MLNRLKLSKENKQLMTASSVIAGTCIGAGFLGIPYVASQAGFFIVLAYLFVFCGIILLINLYLGEIILRTKKSYQLAGYADRYLGKKGKTIMIFATKFTIYSAIVAYLIGIGESLSFLFFGNIKHYLLIGVGFGLLMSLIIWKGISSMKVLEKIGVAVALVLLFAISLLFFNGIDFNNLAYVNFSRFFIPFGVVLFSMMSFFSIPQAKMVLGKNTMLLKKSIIIGTVVPAIFYLVFTLVVVGAKGKGTPEIATFALGSVFILMGIVAMFTSYLSLGNALQQNYIFDIGYAKKKAWVRATLFPIVVFLLIQLFGGFFSFIRVLSIGGIISGGIISILILVIKRRSEKLGKRYPEFKIPINKWMIISLSIVFIFGMVFELISVV
jgi:amino acid permease